MNKDYSDFGITIPFGKRTGNVKTFCPQCHQTRRDKRDKSLSVDLDNGVWNCHYCGWSGTTNVSDFDGSPDGKRRWMERQPWYKATERGIPAYKKPAPRQYQAMSERALTWFRGRGISEETLADCRVTEGEEWMPQKNGKVNTVQFNYYLNGELVNTKFRTGDKCFKLCSGAQLIPYLIDNIKGQKECVITEGEMDALSFYECGVKTVVSVPNGANANLGYLDDFIEDYFEDKETIYIASDTDTKGILLRDELLRRFGAERCRVVTYGDGCKDANEHLMKYGRESLLQTIRDAPEIKLEGVFDLSDFEDNLDALFEHGMQKGATIGHDNFDRLCSFERKRLCVVTGIPGSGKSEFIDEIAERLNIRYGWRFAFFSPENAPLAYHAGKLIEKFTGKRFSKETLPIEEYRQVKRHIEQEFSFINPKEDYKLSSIIERGQFLVRRKGIKALVIDPFNRLDDESEYQNETRHISKILDNLTNFAQRNDVLVILMAHPTKQPRNKDGIIEAPTLYDISGSAHFYNKTDFGIVVHRNRIEDYVEVHVQKVKFRHLGSVGTALFKYNLTNGRYVPYTQDIEPVWDNSNHLTKKLRQREENEDWNSLYEFDAFTNNSDECPF